MCLRFKGQAGTSGMGSEGVELAPCQPNNDRFFWHAGNARIRNRKCCSGLRAWNTEQCLQGATGTGICEISGSNGIQAWSLGKGGLLKQGHNKCLASNGRGELAEMPCLALQGADAGGRWKMISNREPEETTLYRRA